MKIPENLRDIIVTYEKTFHTGPYGDTKKKEIVNRRGFYDGVKVVVPNQWGHFNIGGENCLLPKGFGSDRLKLSEVIKWEYCE